MISDYVREQLTRELNGSLDKMRLWVEKDTKLTAQRITQRMYMVIFRPILSETGVRRSIPTSWPRDCMAPQRAVWCALRVYTPFASGKPILLIKP
jgi:hypothetical protein